MFVSRADNANITFSCVTDYLKIKTYNIKPITLQTLTKDFKTTTKPKFLEQTLKSSESMKSIFSKTS